MNARRDAVRRAVRVTATDLRPDDTVQPWNDRAAPHRTVRATCSFGFGRIAIVWSDDSYAIVPAHAMFHRSNVRL